MIWWEVQENHLIGVYYQIKNLILTGSFQGIRLYYNISKAIKVTRAKAADVSSGVEVKKGIKSIEMIKKFVNVVKNI